MENRAERAQSLHDQGYNCAQAVVCAYCDLFGVDVQTAYKMSESFGLGMGMMEVCGALSGAFMLIGLQNSAGTQQPGATKMRTYETIRQIAGEFVEKNTSYSCRVLKGQADGRMRRTCAGCIEDACRIVEQFLGS